MNVTRGGPPCKKESQNVDSPRPEKAFFFILYNKKQSKILQMILTYIIAVNLKERVSNESQHYSTFVKKAEND